jgi:hypothetical protein
MARTRFLRSNPFLRFLAKPFGLAPTLQRLPLTRPAALPAADTFYDAGWSRCSPGLLHLPGFLSPDIKGSTFLPFAPLVLFLSTSEDADKRNLRGFLPATQGSLLSKGAYPLGVSDRLSSAIS